jgi:tRNA-dihydrouridine synthase B
MKIGRVEIPALARLAPMAGITNAPFRLIARECGSGLTTSEEMDAASLLTGHPHADAVAAYYPAERPLAMQLLGKIPTSSRGPPSAARAWAPTSWISTWAARCPRSPARARAPR